MSLAPELACHELAKTQHGAVSIGQARSCGLSLRAAERRVRAGRWKLALPGVYVIEGSPDSWLQRLWAAHLWGGPRSLISHRSAAAVHGLASFTGGIVEISVATRRRAPDGIVVHRVSPYLEPPCVEIEGLRVASVEKTIFDLASILHRRAVGAALDDAIRKKLTNLEKIQTYLDGIARSGRTGVRMIRSLLEVRDPRHERVRSPLETRMIAIFDDFSLPPPVADHSISHDGKEIAVADFAYPVLKLDIECDSDAFHLSKLDVERDKQRDRRLISLGWTVLRFSSTEIRKRPEMVSAEIRKVISRQEKTRRERAG